MPDISTGEVSSQKLNVNVRMSQKPFFINHEGFLYGPLVIAKTEGNISTLIQYSQTVIAVSQDCLLKLNQQKLKEQHGVYAVSESGSEFIVSLKILNRFHHNDGIRHEDIDFISDDRLIDFYAKAKLGKKATILSKKEAKKFKEGVQELRKKNEALTVQERYIRIQKILETYLLKSDTGAEIVEDYFQNNPDFLNIVISKSPELLEKIVPPEKIEHLNKEVVDLENKIVQLTKQQENQKNLVKTEKDRANEKIKSFQSEADSDIERIRAKTEEEIKKESKDKGEKVQYEIETKLQELKGLDKKLEDFKERTDLMATYDDLSTETTFLEKTLDKLKKAVDKQESILRDPDLGSRLTEVKTIIDMLQGRTFNEENKVEASFRPPKLISNPPSPANGSQYVQSLVEYFENDGYSFSFIQMVNLLINIQQSFLTVLSGLPGTGKTSSLIKLAKSQFLCEKEESTSDCFLNVSVARGWMTARDTIGFYNSLKGIYQPSKTGIYQFLRKGDVEEASSFMRLILLDEANLSPIEHYWSDFLGMCDIDGRNKPIDTGMPDANQYLNIPSNIRFVATINNDSSTEPLSPRLIDRVPIVLMGEDSGEAVNEIASWNVDGAVAYEFLEKCFGKKDVEEEDWSQIQIDEFCKRLSEKIIEKGSPVLVSHRKMSSMYSYYNRAKDYMTSSEAADYAISQHALPLINGHGSAFKERLQSLLEYADANSLTITSNNLDRIIKSGEEYIDSYSFF